MGDESVPGEVIVKFKNGGFAAFQSTSSAKSLSLQSASGPFGQLSFDPSSHSLSSVLEELRQNPAIEYAEPNYFVSLIDGQERPQSISAADVRGRLSPNGYGLSSVDIGAVSAWQALVPSSGILPIVAVIDSGVEIDHEALRDAIWTNSREIPGNGIDDDHNGYVDDVNGWNFADGDNNLADHDGHGTHVSGIVRGISQNLFATTLSTPIIRIMPLKFLGANGVGTTSNAIQAIYYAIDNGARVLNNSWGGSNYSRALHEAIAYAHSAKVLFVAAAGNSSANNDLRPLYPASYDVPNILAVAASNDTDSIAYFSNYGASSVHIAAPGVAILSCYLDGSYNYLSGTSMASPVVSGIAALMMREKPELNAYHVRKILMDSVAGNSKLSGRLSSGGRVNMALAVNEARAVTDVLDSPDYQLKISSADRGLASDLAMGGGGCGMVRNIDGGRGPRGGTGAHAPLEIMLILIPVAVALFFRALYPVNRRRHARIEMDSQVRLMIGDKTIEGHAESISQGGLGFEADLDLKEGTFVRMLVMGPRDQECVTVTGRIVWGQNHHYGVAFAKLADDSGDIIRRWCKKS